MNPERLEDQLAAIVSEQLGARIAASQALAPGLGTRRFFRLQLEGGARAPLLASVIARVEAPDAGDSAPDPRFATAAEPRLEPIRAFLEESGLPVPRRFGGDPALGIELLEDAGTTSLEDTVVKAGADERRALYREACELVPRLQSLDGQPQEIPAFGRRLDGALIATKAEKFIAWAAPWLQGSEATREQSSNAREAFAHIAEVCERAPARLSHRDYKAANIHVRTDREVGARLMLIDLQGAFMAPPEYDLVCLLRDSHVALPDSEVGDHLARVRPQLPDVPNQADFDRRFDLLTLSRVAKDIAHYIHAATEHSDDRYLPLVPNAMRNLRNAAQRAAEREARLEGFCGWIDTLARSDRGTEGTR